MKTKKIVFESPSVWDKYLILAYIKNGYSVYAVEPFSAYHHSGKIIFFPPTFPEFVQNLLKLGEIKLISAEELRSRDIYFLASEKAVEVVEKAYPVYYQHYSKIIDFLSSVLQSAEAEMMFKKNLCDRLGRFFSLDIMLKRLAEVIGTDDLLLFPHANVKSYLKTQKLLNECHLNDFSVSNISFHFTSHVKGIIKNIFKNILINIKVILQIAGCIVFQPGNEHNELEIKSYSYGISIISPKRQLRGNQRGPNFIVDNKKVKADKVIYFSLVPLDKGQKAKLAKIVDSDVFELPRIGKFFSNLHEWYRLLTISIKNKFLRNADEIEIACSGFFNYFRWQNVIRKVKIDHLITHCDFGISQIARNILLKQYGIKTWYFTDASNFGHNLRKNNCMWNRHPFWTYLNYDNLITWYNDLAEYFTLHPKSFKKTHIIGCIWSEHVTHQIDKEKYLSRNLDCKDFENKFIIAVYTSTYTVNGVTSYQEGILFAQHIQRLARECNDIFIIVKEKKDAEIHLQIEPRLGARLIELYKNMDGHLRVKVFTNELDASNLMAVADLIISFPFTSTTFEALSANKPAIWHDPMGYYRNTPYGKIGGVTTHNYDELKTKVLEIKKNPEDYKNPMPMNSPLMDTHRDGKAIDRFRDLLTSE